MTPTSEQVRHQHDTPTPIHLLVEFGKGHLRVLATDTAETEILIGGRHAEDVQVTRTGDEISVAAPRQREWLSLGDTSLDFIITVPAGSTLISKTGSADTVVSGPIGPTRLRSGSGDISVEHADGPLLIDTGSGTVAVDQASQEVLIKSGSGDVVVGQIASEPASVSTGSGDVRVTESHGPVAVKTGSGDLTVGEAHSDVTLSSGSGDLEIRCAHAGQVNMNTGSGDSRIGVPTGMPVWTDISTRSGRINSELSGAGEPEADQPFVTIRVVAASGNVTLTEVA